MQLRISRDITLPPDAATQTTLIVGKRGSGKSSTARRLVEQLHRIHVPFVVLDPVDTWWGLRASRSGGTGLEGVYVFGGRRQDLPLEAAGGTLIAETVCEHRISAVLSVKHLSGRARGTFMADFARTLFQRWAGGVIHLVLEEAHELAPQSPYAGEEEMLGAFKRIWKLGRSSGIGGTAITQRPAALHKDITTQAEVLVVHRIIGPQDVAAIKEWIKYHGQRDEILPQLSELKTGEAFFWAPDFPEDNPIGLRRVRILEPETFDSSATPKAGEKQREPKTLAAADIERLRARLGQAIERAKADDPRELRRRIAELHAELKKAQAARAPEAAPSPKRVEVPVLKDAQIKRLEAAVQRLRDGMAAFIAGFERAVGRASERQQALVLSAVALSDEIKATLAAAKQTGERGAGVAQGRSALAPTAPAPRTGRGLDALLPPAPTRKPAGNGDARLGKGERTILTAIAQHPHGVTREQLTVLTGYRRSSRDTYLQRLHADVLTTRAGDRIIASPRGLEALGPSFQPLPTGDALREYWLATLPQGERLILVELAKEYPRGVAREELDERTSFKRSSRDTYLQRLAARRLIEVPQPGVVRASAELFEGA